LYQERNISNTQFTLLQEHSFLCVDRKLEFGSSDCRGVNIPSS